MECETREAQPAGNLSTGKMSLPPLKENNGKKIPFPSRQRVYNGRKEEENHTRKDSVAASREGKGAHLGPEYRHC